MTSKINLILYILYSLLLFNSGLAYAELDRTEYEECLLNAIKAASPDDQIKKVQDLCKKNSNNEQKSEAVLVEVPTDDQSALKQRLAVETIAEELPNVLVPHNRNYVLPLTYNFSPNQEPFNEENLDIDSAEIKFQFSIKSKAVTGMLFGEGNLWLAYTNQSYWQAYNRDSSSPFRETNHEPEIFLDFEPDLEIGSWESNLLRIGLTHQSNGRGGSLSRSWNKAYILSTLEKDNWYFGLKPWYRIPESKKDGEEDPSGDDNPDLQKFIGYGELLAYYHGDVYTYGFTLRNNLRSENRVGIQFDWTFPLKDKLRGHIQYYHGYGESLIDYDSSIDRIGFGVLFSDLI